MTSCKQEEMECVQAILEIVVECSYDDAIMTWEEICDEV